MADAIEYEQFEGATSGQAPTQAVPAQERAQAEPDLRRLSDIPMELSVELGRTHMTVGETLDLRVGSLVTLDSAAGQPADLLVNGTAIARGEVIVLDERYGLRVTEILEGNDIACSPGDGSDAAGAVQPDARDAAAVEIAASES
ncbi:MAG: flagellar motor switch protein FliN [Solirubrobacteraceae bacterium]